MTPHKCPSCDGTKTMNMSVQMESFFGVLDCDVCDGAGIVWSTTDFLTIEEGTLRLEAETKRYEGWLQ